MKERRPVIPPAGRREESVWAKRVAPSGVSEAREFGGVEMETARRGWVGWGLVWWWTGGGGAVVRAGWSRAGQGRGEAGQEGARPVVNGGDADAREAGRCGRGTEVTTRRPPPCGGGRRLVGARSRTTNPRAGGVINAFVRGCF